MYKLTKDEYNHPLDNAVTATYKKATKGIEDITEGIKYTKRAAIFDRIEINGTSNCFVTLKDHKETLSVFRNINGQQAEKQNNNSKNFQRQRLTNNHKMQSQDG